MSKARSLADLGNVYDDGALSNRNLIINGGNIVSQRGDYTSATSITNNQYYLDRWKIAKSPSATLTHTDRKQKVDATSSTTGTLRCRQPIESDTISTFAGQTVTLSAKVKSNSTNARLNIYADGWLSGTGTPSHSGDGTDEILTYTVTLPTGTISVCTVDVGFDGALSANVSISSGDYFEMSEVQLEVGDTATPFEHRSYGDELARCQRYYEQIEYPVNGAVANCHAYSTSGVHGAFYYNEKRANPSISVNNGVMCYRGTTAQTPTTLNWVYASKRSVNINPVNGMTFSVNDASYVIANASGLSIKIDAEL